MKHFAIVVMLAAFGCASANMEATDTEKAAMVGIESRVRQIEETVAKVASDRQMQSNFYRVALALMEVERTEKKIATDAAKARGLDVAIVLSGTKWVTQR